MLRMKLAIGVIFIILSHLSFADPQRTMMNTFYVQGMLGPGVLNEVENYATTSNKQEFKGQTAISGVIGYRWKYFGVEALATTFGHLSINHDDYYTESHEVSFVGLGVHWAWWFFDLKLGGGSINDKTTYEKGSKATTFSANPNEKSRGQTAGYFGIGFNVDLGPNTEFIIDYTSYAYTKDKVQTFELDGRTSSFSESDFAITTLSFGIRWFL
jgi:hypothetical protein